MLILLGLIIPLLVLLPTKGDLTGNLLLNCLIIGWASYRLSQTSFQSRHPLMQLTFWIFVYCWMGLASAVEIKSNTFPWWEARQTSGNITGTLAVIILGLIAYELGLAQKQKRRINSNPATLKNPSQIRHLALCGACVAISLAAIQFQGGLSSAFQTRHEKESRTDMAKSTALMARTLQHAPPIVALLVTIHLLRRRQKKTSRVMLALLTLVLIAYNMIANYPPSLARVDLGSDVAAVAFLFVGSRRSLKPLVAIGFIIMLVFMFPYLDFFRSVDGYNAGDIISPARQLSEKPDYDAFQMLSNTVSTVSDRGFDFGRNMLASFLFFVPRSKWTSKPHGTGEDVGEYLGYRNTNLSSPLWGELYYAGGVVAVFFGFLVYGYLSRLLEARATQTTSAPLYLVLSYAAGFQIFLLRGDFNNAVAYSAPSYLLFLAFFLRVSRPRRSSAESIPVTEARQPCIHALPVGQPL